MEESPENKGKGIEKEGGEKESLEADYSNEEFEDWDLLKSIISSAEVNGGSYSFKDQKSCLSDVEVGEVFRLVGYICTKFSS